MAEKSNVIEQLWQPLKVERDGTAVRIGCYGRTYRMEGAFPAGIISGGQEVLASPARLRATFCGEEEPAAQGSLYINEQTEDKLAYLHQTTVGNAVLNSRVTVERDGLVWVDLMLLHITQSGAVK